MTKIEIKMFPASYGDSFLVRCFDETTTNILIDMGFKSTYKDHIKNELKRINEQGEDLHLLVFTHIDRDHIQGGLQFIEENGSVTSPEIIQVNEIWHNSYRHLQFDKKIQNVNQSDEEIEEKLNQIIKKGYGRERGVRETSEIGYKQGSTLASLLYEKGYEEIWNKNFNHKAVMISNEFSEKPISINREVKITLLSPDMEKLKRLDYEWKQKLVELGFKDQVYSNSIMDDAFEVYNANLRGGNKKSRRINKVSGRKINVEEAAEQRFEPDNTAINGSSISFILEFQDKRILFLGDSHTDIIEKNIEMILKETKRERLLFDAVKISHHGSKHNTSPTLLQLIESSRYIISTNGKGTGFSHPDLETISRILLSKTEFKKELIFNFKPIHLFDFLSNQTMKDKYNYDIYYKNEFSQSAIGTFTNIII
ncbi:MBL fold metallo-hydrolase [Rossellomorea sp. LJF3]|uniref:MBL fold metallo-hydrolase n=1 Tax=Rossellomorea sp. LJF3 TaxID=3126099 RepID=UPI00300D7BF4